MNPSFTDTEEYEDAVRVELMKALLTTVPPGAHSDSVASFVWDTVERIMQFRAKRQGLIPLPVETPKDIAHPEPEPYPETLRQWQTDIQADLAAVPETPKTPFPTIDPNALPEPPKGANATWGGGAKFGDGTKANPLSNADGTLNLGGADGEHDDGPY